MYRPLYDRVLVELPSLEETAQEHQTEGGIFVGTFTTEQESSVVTVKVLEIGEGEVLYDGTVRNLSVKAGQRVLVDRHEVQLFPSSDPLKPPIGVIGERMVLAILEEER